MANNNFKVEINVNSLDDLYRAIEIARTQLSSLGYGSVRISGSVSRRSSFGKDNFDKISSFKLFMKNDLTQNYDISICGYKVQSNPFSDNINLFFMKTGLIGDKIDVYCISDSHNDAYKFIERIEQGYNQKSTVTNEVSDQSKTNIASNNQINSKEFLKYDVFVSHASADKNRFVEELVFNLSNITSDVWYDRKMIKWGDNIKDRIFHGLENCEFGIVVFSKSFIGRRWTEAELEKLLSKQNAGNREIILPILLDDLTQDELIENYPSLEDIMFIKQSEWDIKDIVIMFGDRLIERLKERRNN